MLREVDRSGDCCKYRWHRVLWPLNDIGFGYERESHCKDLIIEMA